MISNSSPLIFLSKIGFLHLLKELFGTVVIPQEVKDEVVVQGKIGVSVIEEAIQQGWILVQQASSLLDLPLGKGETAAITLARKNGDSLLLDDFRGISTAKIYGIPVLRTTSILIIAFQKGKISKKELLEGLPRLVEAGYYIHPAEYALLLSRLQKI